MEGEGGEGRGAWARAFFLGGGGGKGKKRRGGGVEFTHTSEQKKKKKRAPSHFFPSATSSLYTLAMMQQAFTSRLRILGEEHPNTLSSEQSLAAIIAEQKKH